MDKWIDYSQIKCPCGATPDRRGIALDMDGWIYHLKAGKWFCPKCESPKADHTVEVELE